MNDETSEKSVFRTARTRLGQGFGDTRETRPSLLCANVQVVISGIVEGQSLPALGRRTAARGRLGLGGHRGAASGSRHLILLDYEKNLCAFMSLAEEVWAALLGATDDGSLYSIGCRPS